MIEQIKDIIERMEAIFGELGYYIYDKEETDETYEGSFKKNDHYLGTIYIENESNFRQIQGIIYVLLMQGLAAEPTEVDSRQQCTHSKLTNVLIRDWTSMFLKADSQPNRSGKTTPRSSRLIDQ